MKLVLFDEFQPGVLRGDRVVDVSSATRELNVSSPGKLMPAIIENFERLRPAFEALAQKESGRPLSEVRLRPPNPMPPKLLACFGNYVDTVRDHDKPRNPQDIFLKNSTGIIGDGDTVDLPPHQATIFHHEAELGVIIGKRCKGLPATAAALDAVFGYTCFVDVSGRGLGTAGQNSRMGKAFDTFGPMGPCITTTDEIPDPNGLQVRFWVDGQLRQDYSTETMEYSLGEVVAFASQAMTLLPGDVISCGTHHQGLGPVQDGEQAEMEIERIGRFSFYVRDPYKRSWPVGIDHSPTNPIMRAAG